MKISRNHIITTDNIPVDEGKKTQIIRRAWAEFALLILLFTGRIIELIKTAYKEAGKIVIPFPLKANERPVCIKTSSEKWNYSKCRPEVETNFWPVYKLGLCFASPDQADEFGQTGIIRYLYSDFPLSGIRHNYTGMNREQEIDYCKPDFEQIKTALRRWLPSLLALVEYVMPGINLGKLCRYAGMPDLPFDAFPINRSSMIPVDFMKPDDEVIRSMMTQEPGHVEQWYLCTMIDKICHGESDVVLDFSYAKSYPGNQQFLYAFKNSYGEIIMAAVVVYDLEKVTKSIVPVSTFAVRGTHQRYTLAVPSVKKQPVYNADLIENAEEPPVVVICDSVEIAAINQKDALPGVVFTAWMCDKGHLEQVDLTPLLKASGIVFLIVNHSGRCLEEQYIAASELAAELHAVKGFETKEFRFYQAEFEFKSYRMPYDLDSLFATRADSLGTLIEGSEFEMTEDEFNKMLVKAQESLLAPKTYFWQTTLVPETKDTPASKETKAPQFIIHYWVQRGQLTGIYAKKNHGKSPLAYTLAIAATCCREKGSTALFPERSIIACPDSVYGSHKVLFFDFENGQAEIDAKLKSIGGVYWPDPVKQPEEYQCSMGNLVIVNMQDEKYQDYYGKDLSAPEYRQFILDWIENAKDLGIKGQPVDMVVIDTYNKFVGTESIKTNTNFTKLTRTLRETNIAVVVTGQLNNSDKPRGFQQKLDDEYCTLIIEREDDTHAHSLESTAHTIFPKNYRGKLTEEQLSDLNFTYPMNGKLTCCNQKDKTSKELADASLKGFVLRYAEQGFDYPEIASMLGMKEKTLYDRIPKAEIKKALGKR